MKERPSHAVEVWKYETEGLPQLRESGRVKLRYAHDVDGNLEGIQNSGRLVGIPYDRAAEVVNLLLIPQYADRSREAVRWTPTGVEAEIDQTGGWDNTAQTVDVKKPTGGAVAVRDQVMVGDERCRVLAIQSNTPDASHDRWTLRRAIHGTAATAHANGSKFRLQAASVAMETVVLAGNVGAPATPSNLVALGVPGGIRLSWDTNLDEDGLKGLLTFVVYRKPSASMGTWDPNADPLPLDVVEYRTGDGPEWFYVSADTTTVEYFRVAALGRNGVYSGLAAEANAVALDAEDELTDDLDPPECVLSLSGRMRVLAQALVTQSNARVKDAQIELYFGDTPGDPGAVGTQQVGTTVTTAARSFRHEASVATTYGPGDYWARARLRNVSDVATAWASSALLTVLASDTTDTEVVPVDDVIVAVRVASDPQSGAPWFLFGIEGTAQYDSAEASQVAYSYDWRPGDTFSQGADDPMPGKTHRIFDLPGRAVWSEPARTGRSYWTGRIRNAFGWSLWIPPFEVVVVGDPGTYDPWDADVPELTHFGAWTSANPPPSGTVPGPGQVRFTYTLGSNAATAFSFEVQAYETLPTETVLLSGPTQTATAEVGTFELAVSGYTATLNQFAGNWLRIGKETGSNATTAGPLQGAGLQELKIASNTAGNPFTVTVAGSHQIKAHGELEHWSVVANLSRLIAYKHWAWPIAHGENPAGTYRIHEGDFMEQVDFTKSLLFRAHAHGYWGRSAWRYSDNTAAGTLTSGSAILKAVGRVTAPSLDGEARSQHGVFLETWENGFSAWTLGVQTGTASIREAAGVTGGRVLRMTGRNSLIYTGHIPYDPSKQYRARYRVRQVSDPTAGGKLNYLGNETANASKTDIGQIYTANGVSSTAVGESGAWTEYTSWIKGHGTVVHEATNPLSPSPATTGASYLRPSLRIGWPNNDNTDGVFECDYVAIDVFDEEEIKRLYSGGQHRRHHRERQGRRREHRRRRGGGADADEAGAGVLVLHRLRGDGAQRGGLERRERQDGRRRDGGRKLRQHRDDGRRRRAVHLFQRHGDASGLGDLRRVSGVRGEHPALSGPAQRGDDAVGHVDPGHRDDGDHRSQHFGERYHGGQDRGGLDRRRQDRDERGDGGHRRGGRHRRPRDHRRDDPHVGVEPAHRDGLDAISQLRLKRQRPGGDPHDRRHDGNDRAAPHDTTPGKIVFGSVAEILSGSGGSDANGFRIVPQSHLDKFNSTGIGFFAATPVAKPTVSGSWGGNAAGASLSTALASLGLITDSTT
jgi:hypothetical protein